jgi:hypothetical protein
MHVPFAFAAEFASWSAFDRAFKVNLPFSFAFNFGFALSLTFNFDFDFAFDLDFTFASNFCFAFTSIFALVPDFDFAFDFDAGFMFNISFDRDREETSLQKKVTERQTISSKDNRQPPKNHQSDGTKVYSIIIFSDWMIVPPLYDHKRDKYLPFC